MLLSGQGSLVFCSVTHKLFLTRLKTSITLSSAPDSASKFAVAAAAAVLGLDNILPCSARIILVFI